MAGRGKIRFHCPACGRALIASADAVGKLADCPQCKGRITIPPGLNCPIPDHNPATTLALPTKAKTSASAEARTWRQIVDDCRDLVPLIECAAGIGSGLLVSLDGLVVTNAHVVSRSRQFWIKFFDGSRARGALVQMHSRRDLAILRAAIRRDRCFDIEKCVAEEVEAGDEVLAIGHPRGLAYSSTRGIVSEPHRVEEDGEYVQTDVAMNPGNSGGPLLNCEGMLVALNTYVKRDAEGLGFGIDGKEVQAFVRYVFDRINRGKIHVPSDQEIASAEQSLTPWEIANAAVNATGLRFTQSRLNNGEPCLAVTTPHGMPFAVYIGGNLFVVGGCVAPQLTEPQQMDARLLRQLLQWQNELCGPAFDITGNNLLLSIRRGVEGLDVNEAREAIMRVAEAMDLVTRPIAQHLGR
jgi:hypothetical protein